MHFLIFAVFIKFTLADYLFASFYLQDMNSLPMKANFELSTGACTQTAADKFSKEASKHHGMVSQGRMYD
jgi:hypothetical protein